MIHFYNSTRYAKWYETDSSGILADDDDLESKQCQYVNAQASIKHGGTPPEFVFALYDLINDPYEVVNLYDAGTTEVETVKQALYADLYAVHARATKDRSEGASQILSTCELKWKAAGGYIMPFEDPEVADSSTGRNFPLYCGIWDDSKGSILTRR